MPEKISRKDLSINTIVGPNTVVWGNVETGGFSRVDGSVHGNMSASGQIVVGEKARMRGNVAGTQITIGGVVYGNVLASERLIILSTGLVIGDVITKRVQADDGCIIHGKIVVCSGEEKWNKAIDEYNDELGVREALSNKEAKIA